MGFTIPPGPPERLAPRDNYWKELEVYCRKYGEIQPWIDGRGYHVMDFKLMTYLPKYTDYCIVRDIEGLTPYASLLYKDLRILDMVIDGLEYRVPVEKDKAAISRPPTKEIDEQKNV